MRYSNQEPGVEGPPEQEPSVIIGADGLARPAWAARDPLLRDYYDTEWGDPVRDERGVFERLSLELFQAGLSWRTILAKRAAFRSAFANFEPEAVAAFTDDDVARLLQNAAIVRNRAKIEAVIHNARATVALRETGSDLSDLVWAFTGESFPDLVRSELVPSQSPGSRALAQALREAGFKRVGPIMCFALMEAIGIVDTHLVGTHKHKRVGARVRG
ncbi:DNA-3-methyladenine glycosylase I [Buchananella felis]|uniref:DNA-3-methyladenine glycosylase I n=1 Tax=Buchananella felis TaxID=3231492 RepID=UPI003527DA8C